MDKTLIQRERNWLAERGVELTPDQTEELLSHKLRCLAETEMITTVSMRILAQKMNKASKSLTEFADAAVLFEML